MEFIIIVAGIVLVMKINETIELRTKESELHTKYNSSILPPPIATGVVSKPIKSVSSASERSPAASKAKDVVWRDAMPIQNTVSSTGQLPGENLEKLPDFRNTRLSPYPESINVSVSEFENYYDISDLDQPMAGIEIDFASDFMDHHADDYIMDHDS